MYSSVQQIVVLNKGCSTVLCNCNMYSPVQGLLMSVKVVLHKGCSTVVYKGQHHSDHVQGPTCSFFVHIQRLGPVSVAIKSDLNQSLHSDANELQAQSCL
jgi:hypothetical protein